MHKALFKLWTAFCNAQPVHRQFALLNVIPELKTFLEKFSDHRHLLRLGWASVAWSASEDIEHLTLRPRRPARYAGQREVIRETDEIVHGVISDNKLMGTSHSRKLAAAISRRSWLDARHLKRLWRLNRIEDRNGSEPIYMQNS